ncbi:adenosylcobinamide-GDP ribazoletransferase [Candidatus Desantisbacteria bacterium CG_4_10_14_0_8_um_filter_39_17]|uniref:Adenosylcobinamide-GDP ribazoletransferase n=1 Tax=Candidatus Desantisbacteria bacterium CG_4_10_14_0_8_um_filter_39_17 TaxID=1974542 RepID=A0A2H9PBJ5_9BACT|nr:MAG: adenosylcobinamide-GDP ribazoletransferase [Candidatus Desantisbacteria bacterium CG_4_10_14_0_8_um_filter_39_17]
MKRFLIALQFLTIIPVKVKDVDEKDSAKSAAFFPVVGIVIGILLVLFYAVLSQLMPAMPADVFVIIFWIFITGVLHLDGLADTMDGFYASTQKEKILKVMEDTSTGAKGVAALIILLLFKFALLSNIEGAAKIYSLILAPTISRYSMFIAIASSSPARKEGMGKLFIGKTGLAELIFSSIIMVLICLTSWFLPLGQIKMLGFIAVAVAVIITLTFVRYCNYKIGGMTGDTLGALNEIVEVAVLLSIVVVEFTRL